MVPKKIEEYLHQNGIAFEVRTHPRAISAQEIAAAEHVTGWKVFKCVVAEVDGKAWICAIPAPELLDMDALCETTGGRDARLVPESRLEQLFPGCELGAAPPLGKLWGLPCVADRSIEWQDSILVNGGSHDELLELRCSDFVRVEQPKLGAISALPGESWRHAMRPASPEPHPWHHR